MSDSISVKDIQGCFHFSLDEAAKRLGIGSTALKKLCRIHGIKRWPYRRLRCLDRTIITCERKLLSQTTRYEENLRKLSSAKAQKQAILQCLPEESVTSIEKQLYAKTRQEKLWYSCGIEGSALIQKAEKLPQTECETPLISSEQETKDTTLPQLVVETCLLISPRKTESELQFPSWFAAEYRRYSSFTL